MGVATAVAIGGLAVSAASTTNSFIQAGKQKKAQRAAEAKAAEAMAEARKKLEINYAEELSIKKEPYELEREAMLAQGALAIQQGGESDRGAEATAGRVQMAQNEGQAGIRTAMGQELMGIEQQIINEDSRLRDVGVQLDLGEVEGAQLAARDAEEARAAAITQGFEGLSNTMQQGLAMVPLFPKTGSPQVGQQQAVQPQASNQSVSNLKKPTGYSVFDEKFKPNPVGFGKSAFNPDPFAPVSFPQSIGYQPTKKYF
jgi:hypothetical protein